MIIKQAIIPVIIPLIREYESGSSTVGVVVITIGSGVRGPIVVKGL